MNLKGHAFRSVDERFTVVLPEAEATKIQDLCAEAFPNETGGLLTGIYSADHTTAYIRDAHPPPADSRFGRMWFERGISGLQALSRRLWRRRQREYYLGEWHFHPSGKPVPSTTDEAAMTRIAGDQAYQCPEPVLIIVAGKPDVGWLLSAWVYEKGRRVELTERR